MLRSWLLFVLIILVAGRVCAQSANDNEFLPRQKVIFEDDFSEDAPGSFPSRWQQNRCNSRSYEAQFDYRRYWKVQAQGSRHVLEIRTTLMSIEPIIALRHYLPDSFSVECYFSFDTSGCAELNFYSDTGDTCRHFCYHVVSTGALYKSKDPGPPSTLLSGYPGGVFDGSALHHFALSYNKRNVDIFVDNVHLYSEQDCGFTPSRLSLSCIAPVKYTGFRVATGKKADGFSKILKEKKLTTHAINFEVNKWTIKPESMDYIARLAAFLNENKKIRLEIDGHTDSDGSADANMKLSQARADEVRKQLIAAGVDAARLTAKGFGDTKPVKPNSTQEGKAENRRVEFIRL